MFWSVFGGVSAALSSVVCMKYLCKKSMPNQVILAVLGIGILASFFSIIHSSVPSSALKMIILLCAAVPSIFIYIQDKKIPMEIIWSAAGLRIGILIAEIIMLDKEYLAVVMTRDILGGIFGFGVPILVDMMFGNVFTKDEIKLFGIMGIYCGYSCTYDTLIFALVVSYLIKLIIIYKNGAKKNVKIPFEPFLLCGYIIMMMLYRM